MKQWAGADEKRNFRDFKEDFSLESFTQCTDFNPIEIYAYYIGRCINTMENGVFLKYYLSYPIKYEKHQAEKIRESFEKGLKKSLPRHVFDDEKTAKMFKVELRASEPCAYALSAFVIAKPNYDGIDEQRFGSFMQKSREARLNLQTIASKLCGFLENLDAHIIEAIEENEEFDIGELKKDLSKNKLFDRNGKEVEEIELKIDCKELLELLKSKIDDGVTNFFAGFSKVMAENIDNQCRAFHIFLGENASKSVLVKQAFEDAKEKQLKAYK
ncbi:hypothetical protein HpM042_04940 [Helicobacter pylori]